MNKTASIILPCTLLFALFALSAFPLPGVIGEKRAAHAQSMDEPYSGALLEDMPAALPDNYTDDEIDRMLDDIEAVEEGADPDREKAASAPELNEAEKKLLVELKNDPDSYYDSVQTTVWLDMHYGVVWHLCSDFAWMDAHPRFAARIYLNYRYWQQYPAIAYIIVLNRPFFVRYPRITLVVYQHDAWFIRHPYIAREIYLNHVIFNRYPGLVHRYYRHHEWIRRYPAVARAAYGNRKVVKAYPGYRGHAYRFRRHAVEKRLISAPHMKKMYERRGEDKRRRSEAAKIKKDNRKTVKYRRPEKERRDKGRQSERERPPREQKRVVPGDQTRRKIERGDGEKTRTEGGGVQRRGGDAGNGKDARGR
ncbi:MAG: hypothetical protein E4G96_08385 [Chrysiogenales bacterium]|nr:MAG: hypothetical protein E4G96_08385 [Chrysiogenales bacterium]